MKELEQSVESWASSLGFDKRIEFTDLNIAKFYKVIDQPEEPFWYHYRICAQHGGITPVVYSKEMANVIKNIYRIYSIEILHYIQFFRLYWLSYHQMIHICIHVSPSDIIHPMDHLVEK